VTTHPAVTGAAVLASLIVGGGVYTARHSTSDAALTASADARRAIEHTEANIHRIKLLSYHPPHVKHVARRAPAAATAVDASVAAPAAAPQVVAVPAQTPVTSTSPTAGGDDSSEGHDD
jgi:hypothetical protein